MPSARFYALAFGAFLVPAAAHATKPKLDSDTCAQLRVEETKFRQAGILSDMSKGPAWAKANLSADRLREVQRYIALDEQVRFGCRDAKLSLDAAKASEAAARIEVNSDADPTVPLVKDPAKPGANPAVKTKKAPAKSKHKKAKTGDPKSGSLERPQKTTTSSLPASSAPQPSVVEETGSTAQSSGFSTDSGPALPAFGFGETVVLPPSTP
ncbi:MAG TPA: hypothetical protein VHC71_01750 [Hyphomicrobium sp.]|nr:hypothetical protein [Hyphomicrobium sp.]